LGERLLVVAGRLGGLGLGELALGEPISAARYGKEEQNDAEWHKEDASPPRASFVGLLRRRRQGRLEWSGLAHLNWPNNGSISGFLRAAGVAPVPA
jgi:hypothetical protein